MKITESIRQKLNERLSVPAEGKQTVIVKLQEVMKEIFALQIKGQTYHWNLRGPSFLEIHNAFSWTYRDMSYQLDRIAERIEAFGGMAYLDIMGIMSSEGFQPIRDRNSNLMLADLQDSHQKLADSMREVVKICETFSDVGTVNILSNQIEDNEKSSWKLKSYLENGTIENDNKLADSSY